jgi:hypothetical protein
MCKCGCRGWCTLFPLVMTLAVDLLACARGGYKWVPKNIISSQIDQNKYWELVFLIAVIEIRTDWPAFCEVIGVRQWGHATYPCPKCNLTLQKMITTAYLSQVTVDSGPWKKYGQQEYLEDVKRSSIVACLH